MSRAKDPTPPPTNPLAGADLSALSQRFSVNPTVTQEAPPTAAKPRASAPAGTVSDFERKKESKKGHQELSGTAVAAAVALASQDGDYDPELDLVQLSIRVPRYKAEAFHWYVTASRRRKQDVMSAILSGGLPEEVLQACYDAEVAARKAG